MQSTLVKMLSRHFARGVWIYFLVLTIPVAMAYRNAEHGSKLAKGNTKFALDMYRQIASKEKNGNIFFSPGSISVALAMTYLGAKNNTAKEMKSTMGLDSLEDEHLHMAFEDLYNSLQETGGNYTLHMANKLFGEQSYSFLQDFLDKQMVHYKAQLVPVDFRNNFEGARLHINKWVEDQTAEKIKDLLQGGALDSLTRLVLVNAVYFKGKWDQQFDPEDTRPGDFWLNANDKVQVNMMNQEKNFNYGLSRELNDCKILELPYLGGKMSMFILLPSKVDGLAELESKLTVEHLVDPVKAFRMGRVKTVVSMPKFKLEQSFDLKSVLNNLGMKDLFSPDNADLSGTGVSNDLFVSRAVHKACVYINESGTEAVAATAVVERERNRPNRFTVDRPFLFVITDTLCQSLQFVGRGVNPEEIQGQRRTREGEREIRPRYSNRTWRTKYTARDARTKYRDSKSYTEYSSSNSRTRYSGRGSRTFYSDVDSRSRNSDRYSGAKYSNRDSRTRYSGGSSQTMYGDMESYSRNSDRNSWNEFDNRNFSTRNSGGGSGTKYSDVDSGTKYRKWNSRSSNSDSGKKYSERNSHTNYREWESWTKYCHGKSRTNYKEWESEKEYSNWDVERHGMDHRSPASKKYRESY